MVYLSPSDSNYKAGHRAYREGIGVEANPHPYGTLRYKHWLRGWMEGQRGRLKGYPGCRRTPDKEGL